MDKQNLIKNCTIRLFSQYGWERVSVGDICQQADISRVTFYKYFKNKRELIKQLFLDQIVEMNQQFEQLIVDKLPLDQVIHAMLDMQKQAMTKLYSQPMVYDLQHHKDKELTEFFAQLEQQKYQFMHYFFAQLQKNRIIRDDFPVLLIEVFIRKVDELKRDPELAECYQGKEQQFLKDVLSLLMYGIAARQRDE
ncbi:TetR/AcrR family transcriptional regulator [Lonepinella sp. BR2271]|uniref:TetR/AcrR family transcriptional regulator n=1 Tax=Lonepinella sp. BR2271 TaxID=3434550 RepID=UPI003F6E193F